MNVSHDLEMAMHVLLAGGFKSQKDYDDVVINLRNLCAHEHRRLTTAESGERCSNEFGNLCQDFVADVYFGGVNMLGLDVGMRRLARRLKSAVSAQVRKKAGVEGGSVVYNDELSEVRIHLMDREGICQAVEASFSAKTREKLQELRGVAKA